MGTSKMQRHSTSVLSGGSLVHTGTIAQELGVTPQTVRNLIGSGYLQCVHQRDGIGGCEPGEAWHLIEFKDGVFVKEYLDPASGLPWSAKGGLDRTPPQYWAWRAGEEAKGKRACQQSNGEWTVGY